MSISTKGRSAAIAAGITIPLLVLSVMLYLGWNNKGTNLSDSPAITQSGKMAPDHLQVVGDMAARLEQNPNDGQGWVMLARSYAVMGRYTESAAAYEKAANLIPNDAMLLVDYADVLAVANDRKLQGKPLELVHKALKLDPDNVKGLALMGTGAFQAEDYAKAVSYWDKTLPLLPPDSPIVKEINNGIAEARARIAGKQPLSQAAQDDKTRPATGNAQISGVVTLSPTLASKVSPTASVFLSAKEVSGSPIPIAVIRAQVKDLPLKFTLDDSMAMMPAMKLSNYQEVMVIAKISKSGSTISQSGDLKGEVTPVKVGADGIQVTIDKVIP